MIHLERQPKKSCQAPKVYKRVVAQCSGHVKPHELVAIMGPSGAGKTSLLNVLSRRESTSGGSYSKGSIKVNNSHLYAADFGKIAAFVQ